MKRAAERSRTGHGLTRRNLLRGIAMLAALGGWPGTITGVGAQAAPAGALSRSQFDAMSTALAGGRYAQRRVVDALVVALVAALGADTLQRVARMAIATPPATLGQALSDAGLTHAAETVVATLATGIVETSKGPRVITYDDALIWQALSWTKPNAFCGGQVDYWSTPPQGGTR